MSCIKNVHKVKFGVPRAVNIQKVTFFFSFSSVHLCTSTQLENDTKLAQSVAAESPCKMHNL